MLTCHYHIAWAPIVVFSLFRKKPQPAKHLAARRASAARQMTAASAERELDAMTVGRGMRLEIGASGLDHRVEQAAILFAAGHDAEARALLEAALRQGDAPEECWLMLFELYELLGEERRYAAVAPKYAERFKRAPPSLSPPTAATVPQGERRLYGQIVAAGADNFSFLTAPSGAEVDIDASQLQRMDFVSAGILCNTMLALHQAGKRVRIKQLSHLVAALLASVGVGSFAALETRNN